MSAPQTIEPVDPFEMELLKQNRLELDLDEQIPFGKHRGTAIRDIPVGYIEWLLRAGSHDWVEYNRDALQAALTYIDESALPQYTLAVDQQQASDEICYSLFEAGNPMHRLQGGAGKGKTFACQDVVIRAKRLGYQVRFCAASYVATENLAKDLDPLGVDCRTIARMLLLDVTHQGPRDVYAPGVDTELVLSEILNVGNLLGVDEYSMTDDVLANVLISAATRYGGKLLVVGDSYQLPSPAQNWDSLLTQIEPVSTLTIPKRFAEGSTLHQVEKIARDEPFAFHTNRFRGCSEVAQAMSLPDLVDTYVGSYQDNPDDRHLMLWYRRKDMAASNRMIRAALFGADVAEICEGEQLRVQRTSDFTPYYQADGTRVYSGTTLDVTGVQTGQQQIHIEEMGRVFEIPVYWVDVGHLWRCAVLFSITENKAESGTRGADEFNAALNEISDWCSLNNNWQPYRSFRNCFVQVAYQYASTVHRVQGQSVDRIFTSPEALRMADPYTAAKLQYVGLTRAKKKLTCL